MAFSKKEIDVALASRAARLAARRSGVFRYCPVCNAMIDDRASSCPSCGTALIEQFQDSQEPPARQKHLVMVPKPERKALPGLSSFASHPCPECGEEMLDNQANCTSCGYFEGEVIYGSASKANVHVYEEPSPFAAPFLLLRSCLLPGEVLLYAAEQDRIVVWSRVGAWLIFTSIALFFHA